MLHLVGHGLKRVHSSKFCSIPIIPVGVVAFFAKLAILVVLFGLYFRMLLLFFFGRQLAWIVVGTNLLLLLEITGSLEPSEKASWFFWHLNPCFAHTWRRVTSCACRETCDIIGGEFE